MPLFTPFIDGNYLNWEGPALDSVDPANAKVRSQVARCSADQADAAIRSAARAFRTGPRSQADTDGRAAMLGGLANVLQARREELVEPEVRDNGKPIIEVRGQFAGLHT